MREILFKAKRKDNGEWVEGYYLHRKEHEILEIGTRVIRDIDHETICQYTELTDKNGNKIWENDVVLDSEEREVYKMVWIQDSMRYCVEKANGFDYEFDSSYASSIEVIGNIFDNPELIGE